MVTTYRVTTKNCRFIRNIIVTSYRKLFTVLKEPKQAQRQAKPGGKRDVILPFRQTATNGVNGVLYADPARHREIVFAGQRRVNETG